MNKDSTGIQADSYEVRNEVEEENDEENESYAKFTSSDLKLCKKEAQKKFSPRDFKLWKKAVKKGYGDE